MSDKERNFTCDLHCKGAVTPMCAQPEVHVPIHLKNDTNDKRSGGIQQHRNKQNRRHAEAAELPVRAFCRDAEAREAA